MYSFGYIYHLYINIISLYDVLWYKRIYKWHLTTIDISFKKKSANSFNENEDCSELPYFESNENDLYDDE